MQEIVIRRVMTLQTYIRVNRVIHQEELAGGGNHIQYVDVVISLNVFIARPWWRSDLKKKKKRGFGR